MGDFDSPYGAVRELAEARRERDEFAYRLGEEIARTQQWIRKCGLAQKRADMAEAALKDFEAGYKALESCVKVDELMRIIADCDRCWSVFWPDDAPSAFKPGSDK